MKVEAKHVHETLERSILVEGYPMVLDMERSHGSWLYDARSDREFLDFFTFYCSRPVAFNHPRLRDPEYLGRVLLASRFKPSNGDVYTTLLAEFVETFRTHALGPGMKHLFFIDGGALAVENALKAAFDWKQRKNVEAGRGEKDLKVIHFTQAFHGRSGYTLSLTNTTDPAKTKYFPKFDWPRIPSPAVQFPLNDANRAAAIEAERHALYEIDEVYARHGADSVACIIIEPIQAEGGDRHFRPEFLRALRKICDARETLLIFDEVQTGIGGTGSMWYYEQVDVQPDIVAFAKKAQTGGIMASARLDEVDSVFKVQSRISSTFGGNLVDFVRCTRYLEIIESEHLVGNARNEGDYFLKTLQGFAEEFEGVTNARGAGLLAAIDLPDGDKRDAVINECRDQGLIILGCGDRTVRLRPALDVTHEEAELGMARLSRALEIVVGA